MRTHFVPSLLWKLRGRWTQPRLLRASAHGMSWIEITYSTLLAVLACLSTECLSTKWQSELSLTPKLKSLQHAGIIERKSKILMRWALDFSRTSTLVLKLDIKISSLLVVQYVPPSKILLLTPYYLFEARTFSTTTSTWYVPYLLCEGPASSKRQPALSYRHCTVVIIHIIIVFVFP